MNFFSIFQLIIVFLVLYFLFLHKKRILLGWNKEKYNVIFEKASFVLGSIDYNENGEVKFLNSEANGILEFRIVD